MVDVGLGELLGPHLVLLLSIQLLGDQSVFGGYGEVSHRKVEDLPDEGLGAGCTLGAFGLIVDRSHLYHFAD